MTQSQISPDSTVRDLAVLNPDVTRVFETLGIDYCCGGRRSLQDASNAVGLPVGQVLESLQEALRSPATQQQDWSTATLRSLIRHILDKHHAYLRSQGPRIAELLSKVVNRHGILHPEIVELQATFTSLMDELSLHMLKEEQVLFPMVGELEELGDSYGSIACPVRAMIAEHDDAGSALASIRRLTNGFQLPTGACTTFQVLYQALAVFEQDLHQHIHLENNILFPKALALQYAGGQ